MSRARSIAKWAGVGIGGLAALAGAGLLYVWLVPLPRREVHAPDLKVEVTPARVERGHKLASMLCAHCHYDAETGALSGRQAPYPQFLGTFYSRNLTPGPANGIASWSDGELVYYLRTGIGPDGRQRFMGPEMHMADEDLLSIVAFLRSDDPWVRPVVNDLPASSPSLMGKIVIRNVLGVPEYPKEPIPMPDPADQVAVGHYVVTAVAVCFGCHSGNKVMDMDFEHPEATPNYLGGRADDGGDGVQVWTQNLTFDDETGLGQWTFEEFDRAVRRGFAPDGRVVRPPMALYPELTDDEIAAVWAYLQTVPKIHKPRGIPLPEGPTLAGLSPGEAAYDRYGCPACHGNDGHLSCDLRGANHKFADDASLEAFIRHPESFVSPTKMPAWDGLIAEADWAPLVGHVRELGRRASGSATP